jgi:hypothetical protein
MTITYWVAALAGAVFLGWAHDHTDEVPIVFGFVMIVGAVLGAVAPRRYLASWVIASVPVPIVETLLHFRLIGAPYPPAPTKDLPLIALAAAVPALIGVAAGAGLRRMLGGAAIP